MSNLWLKGECILNTNRVVLDLSWTTNQLVRHCQRLTMTLNPQIPFMHALHYSLPVHSSLLNTVNLELGRVNSGCLEVWSLEVEVHCSLWCKERLHDAWCTTHDTQWYKYRIVTNWVPGTRIWRRCSKCQQYHISCTRWDWREEWQPWRLALLLPLTSHKSQRHQS